MFRTVDLKQRIRFESCALNVLNRRIHCMRHNESRRFDEQALQSKPSDSRCQTFSTRRLRSNGKRCGCRKPATVVVLLLLAWDGRRACGCTCRPLAHYASKEVFICLSLSDGPVEWPNPIYGVGIFAVVGFFDILEIYVREL